MAIYMKSQLITTTFTPDEVQLIIACLADFYSSHAYTGAVAPGVQKAGELAEKMRQELYKLGYKTAEEIDND